MSHSVPSQNKVFIFNPNGVTTFFDSLCQYFLTGKTDKPTDRRTDKDRQTDIQTDRQTADSRQTADRQIDT